MFKKHKKLKIMIITFCLLILLTSGYIVYKRKWQVGKDVYIPPSRPALNIEWEEYRDYKDMLTENEMIDDLQQLKTDLLQVHPNHLDGFSKDVRNAFESAFKKVKSPMTVYEFRNLLSEIFAKLGDAHTTISPISLAGYFIPIDLKVMENGFYVINGHSFKPGDKVISIGGIPIEEIYEEYKKRISAENIYWVNAWFENNPLHYEMISQMGGVVLDDNIDIIVKRNGELIKITINPPFSKLTSNTKYKNYKSLSEQNKIFLYDINHENSYVHFVMKACKYNEEYEQFLEMMFKDIKENKIENIILDLRGNVGGSSTVARAFLKYIDVEGYLSFGGKVRYSKQISKRLGYNRKNGVINIPNGYVKNDKKEELVFGGNIYVLIDNETFSSAVYFSTLISDNELGTTIGRPTGGMPTSYGKILRLQLKHSKLHYKICYAQFIRPSKEKRYEDSLYPDYEVHYTIEDYIEGRDLDMEKVVQLIIGSE